MSAKSAIAKGKANLAKWARGQGGLPTTFQISLGPTTSGEWAYIVAMPASGVAIMSGAANSAQNALAEAGSYLARKCRVCGCGFLNPCKGGCSWFMPNLCSACVGPKGRKGRKS